MKAVLEAQENNKIFVPIYHKSNLSIDEAAEYFNIGKNKLRELIKEETCEYVLYVGNRALIKRKSFEEYLNQTKYL